MLSFLKFVVELFECLLYVARHGYMQFYPLVISIKRDANVSLAIPFCHDGVIFLNFFLEMLCMLFANIFYLKVVYH